MIWIYWLNISLISVLGTMVADRINLEPVVSTPIFGLLLAIIWVGWSKPVLVSITIFIIITLVAYMEFTHMDVKKKIKPSHNP